jgi:hypothetical protein
MLRVPPVAEWAKKSQRGALPDFDLSRCAAAAAGNGGAASIRRPWVTGHE